ncbi:hypothetical protein DMN91_004704 [Ooceraea biroi]|uniref:Sentrin-specific protease n=1 Tax=Ooceraea biroi TaxID=2015173 RepID=A0A026WCN4_OOCBI|nr:sentrin-specific protease 8 [Ooceraea biroi]EZA53436.1 Sentrin-specific protease [Ooceraea biroi]RLU22426.1 hypothetical protein DMN91_004704 [Ooceraea biroi]
MSNCLTSSSHDLTSSNKNAIVLSYHDYLLRSSDVALLKSNDWLNDVLIGFYFEYLNQQHKTDENKQILFIGPEVAQLLKMMQDSTQFNIFLDPIGAASYNFIFFPINDCDNYEAGGSHWSLLVYCAIEKMCYHFDSSRGINSCAAEKLAQNIIKYFSGKQEKKYIEKACPQQNNAYDCGLFVLCLADVISRYVLQTSKIDSCNFNEVTKMVSQKRSDLLKLIRDLKDTFNTT